MENDAVRDLRRALSKMMTELINTSPVYPKIRRAALESLEELNERLTQLESAAYADLQIDAGQPLLRFFMKGGNAYKCVLDPVGIPVVYEGGGNSDWDTQVIVNPWAPLPVQQYLYARIEDIIRDQMIKTGVEIARVAVLPGTAPFPESPETRFAEDEHGWHCYYELTMDDPQTLRQVFDYERLGMWMNARTQLSNEHVDSELLPGILLNDGIVPFQLFRLGYTWHAAILYTPPPPPAPVDLLFQIGPAIERPILMELIDVTLPRRNTVEAVEQWQQFATGELAVAPVTVGILDGDNPLAFSLPMPGLTYHLHEQAVMVCEVADGSSKHADKLRSRLERFDTIWNTLALLPAGPPLPMISQMAGTTNLAGFLPVPAVDATIAQKAPAYGPGTANYLLPGVTAARQLMYSVASRQVVYNVNNYLAGRKAMHILSSVLGWSACFSSAAYTDDMALRSTLSDNGYFNQANLKSSGFYIATVLRLIEHQNLDLVAQDLDQQLQQLPQFRTPLLRMAQRESDDVLKAILELTDATTLEVKRLNHNTIRHSGISYEQTLVVFCEGAVKACFTLTTAPPEEAPFRPEPMDLTVMVGSAVDQGEQRKAAAALIHEYAVRAALEEQFKTLKWLFPGF